MAEDLGDIGAAAAEAAGVPSSDTPPGQPPSPSGTPAGTPGAPGSAPINAAPRQYQYQEDRSAWVPPHRLRETTERQRQAEQRVQQYERDLHYERQRVAALSGVQPPPAPVDEETRAIRAQFERIYPGLGKLEAMADKLAALKDFDPNSVSAAQEQQYEVLGNQALARLGDRAAEIFGGELSPMAKQSLEMTFGAWVHNNPELHSRYAMQDPKLFDDFFAEYSKSFIDPIRRKVTTSTAPRDRAITRLPRSGPGSAIPGPGPKTLKPEDTEAYHEAAFNAMQR